MQEKLLITDILRDVSRSFYLSMRVLPYGMRAPVSLAYLIARAADTIADSPGTLLPVRLEILRLFKAVLLSFRPSAQAGLRADSSGESAKKREGEGGQENGSQVRSAELQLRSSDGNLSGNKDYLEDGKSLYERAQEEIHGATAGEKALLSYLPDIFRLLSCQKTFDREEICKVCSTLISGMEMDLTATGIFTAADLDHYTYLVAGCVGPFWTQMIARHTSALSKEQADSLEKVAVNFGKALQMTNILRDIPKDLANGRCYIPSVELARFMGNIAGLEHPDVLRAARPQLIEELKRAVSLYKDAVDYTLNLPFWSPKLRLACIWPVAIGLATLAKLARSKYWLDTSHRVKVSRSWVYKMMLISLPLSLATPLLRRAFEWQFDNIEKALKQA